MNELSKLSEEVNEINSQVHKVTTGRVIVRPLAYCRRPIMVLK